MFVFVEVLKTNQPKVSRHLAYLRRAGLVSARREGKWMNYKLVEPPDAHAAKIFREVRDWLANNPEMQRDKTRLAKICCAPQLPVQLQKHHVQQASRPKRPLSNATRQSPASHQILSAIQSLRSHSKRKAVRRCVERVLARI